MNPLRVSLFGRFQIQTESNSSDEFGPQKARELLCYLLLNRDRPHSRELLASMLWDESCTTSRSRKYLRNAIWRLNSSIEKYPELAGSTVVSINHGWIELRSVPALWVDVDVFERANLATMGVPERALTLEHAESLREAADLYMGPLLVNWQQDWCLVERQRLHNLYLIMLEKLSGYYRSRRELEVALFFAEKILSSDRAHEAAHRRIMRLFTEMGARTSALRQFEWCAQALHDELDTRPEPATVRLYEEIRGSSVGTKRHVA